MLKLTVAAALLFVASFLGASDAFASSRHLALRAAGALDAPVGKCGKEKAGPDGRTRRREEGGPDPGHMPRPFKQHRHHLSSPKCCRQSPSRTNLKTYKMMKTNPSFSSGGAGLATNGCQSRPRRRRSVRPRLPLARTFSLERFLLPPPS